MLYLAYFKTFRTAPAGRPGRVPGCLSCPHFGIVWMKFERNEDSTAAYSGRVVAAGLRQKRRLAAWIVGAARIH